MFDQPFTPYTPPANGQTYKCMRGDNHLEIYLCVTNAGSRSSVSVSWISPRHPEIEQFGGSVVRDVLNSLPDEPIRISRKTTITYGVNHWSIVFIPADHALNLAGKIFPAMIKLWTGWCRAVEANPDNLDMNVLSIVIKQPAELPAWLKAT